ncbi:MAG: hypothetical protein IT254_07270 [Chitinophagaceae bacterium]|nr:hypothetical protein [Bacteroidota bacterium]MCC6258103.1 hypothetical protein [Chitinophagaceae bacterium]MCW5917908.1 hypothetical protein [Ferruginibacter sp.]
MKRILLALFGLVLFSFATEAQDVKDKVKVEHNGSWYDAHILKVNPEKGEYYIKYDDWSDSWNEWVTKDRLKGYEKPALTKFKVGDKVEVEYGMVPAPATVVEVGENKYHIVFDKKAFGDKWVAEGQIKKL